MLNTTLKRALAAGAVTMTLAGGTWAATDLSASAVQNRGSDGGGMRTQKKPGARDFGSTGQGAMKAKLERDAANAARRAAGHTPTNGYRYDSGRGAPLGGNPFQPRGGCGRPCSKGG